MSTELSKSLVCIQMRSGVEVWIESQRADNVQATLQAITQSKFIKLDNQTLNTADIVGVFQASTMEAATRRKNGQTQCKEGAWHDKNEKCDCLPEKTKRRHEQIAQAIRDCGKCVAGFRTLDDGSVTKCECIASFTEEEPANSL